MFQHEEAKRAHFGSAGILVIFNGAHRRWILVATTKNATPSSYYSGV
jgi:hypothetical protein